MTLQRSDVENIAGLARLAVSDDTISQYQTELSKILDLVAQMNTADTDNIEPLAHPTDAVQRLRADVVTEGNQREKFQTIAPATEAGCYLVPKVIE